jgi:hypothetical protein
VCENKKKSKFSDINHENEINNQEIKIKEKLRRRRRRRRKRGKNR